ncbi:hypothetical protein V5O48_010936 [Marasmius crinis-equi]|uniref:RTA1-domain-containing protein n=1 Tax=Marasmius crinis-equi TaxID=585013 RepID=A0ABR3F6Z7_9AGAR
MASSFCKGVALACLIFSPSISVTEAKGPSVPRPDPFADPEHDPYNPLRYIASNTLTAIAVALILSVALLQTWCTIKWGGKYMLSMVIGAYFFAFGIAMRFGLHSHPQSKPIYVVFYLVVILSPCGFIAATYVLLGRLSRYLKCDEHLLVSPRRITMIFVASDVITFLIQVGGGSTATAVDDPDIRNIGVKTVLVGLVLQLASFVFFTAIFLLFIYRVHTQERAIWEMHRSKKWYDDWRVLVAALSVSCVGILVRSVYRTIEFAEGFFGHLATTEAYFYALDTLPLFVAIAVYVPFWPGRLMRYNGYDSGVGVQSWHAMADVQVKAPDPTVSSTSGTQHTQ